MGIRTTREGVSVKKMPPRLSAVCILLSRTYSKFTHHVVRADRKTQLIVQNHRRVERTKEMENMLAKKIDVYGTARRGCRARVRNYDGDLLLE